ncbi:enhancer of mRNA-decapping protein 4 homolog [Calliphora vicina]|uniref:enhancer of mRNA-decapping protein 4 homolog n=1 Tax=Calliphora vicina TaxID=7373 RepID=UPI00325AAA26
MLIALLTVDAVLKKSLLRSFQRRGNTLESSQASINNPSTKLAKHQNLQLSSGKKAKVKVSSRFSTNPTMSTIGRHQSPSTGSVSLTSKTMTENIDNIINNNTAIISFKSGDKQCCHEIKSKNVKIIANPGTHDHGSSKVKLKSIVDYIWEVKHYPGHLIAVDIDEKYIAYVINVNNKVSRMEGMVRVVNTAKGLRALIKGMSGEVLDLQFAHIEKEKVLASIDANSLYVHKIVLHEGTLLCNLILKIEDPLTNYTPKYDKISWCPFIQLPGEDDEDSQLIVWARGSLFQCFNVNIVVADQGFGKFQASEIKSGYLKHYDETKTITWVALSPDGSTLGVGNTDGVILFYQVYIHDKEPRCLHEWKPYNDKPVSSFFFLDNLTKNNSDTYWKFAITGADNNTEFKVWDCGTWNCLQTINFSCSTDKPLRFVAELDRTSSYLVVSSLETRTCYVMQIINTSSCYPAIKEETSDNEESINKDTSGSSVASSSTSQMSSPVVVYIKSISEFPLSSGILSFSIVDAAVRRYKCSNDNYMCEELDDYDEETSSIYCVVVHMYVVQAKSMQECHILYQPSVPENADVKSTMSSSDTSAVSRSNTSNKTLPSNASESNERTDDDDDDDVKVLHNENDMEELTRNIPLIKDEFTGNKQNALELLLDIASSSNVSSTGNITSSSGGSTVVAVAAAAAAAPSVIATENNVDSRNPSPKVATSNKNYPQLNLMTPDAFTSTSSANNERKTPENVSSEVLNTILMLAGVAGQNAGPVKSENINLLNLVNNKIIEDKEQQKMQLKHHNLESQKNFMAIDRNPGRNIGENLASGGSSPSREVQEIMSLQEYDKSSYSGDELLEDNNEHVTETDAPGSDDINVTAPDPLKTNTKLAQTTAASSNWPKVPDVPKVSNNKHSAELQNAANLISQAVNASSMSNLSNSHIAPTLGNASNNSSNNNNNNNIVPNNMNNVANDLSDINGKISELIDLVKMQSIQISSLQNEVSELKKVNGNFSPKNMTEFGYKLEMQLSKLMEKYLLRYETEHNRKLSKFLAGKDVQNRELRDSIMQIMNRYVLTQFGEMMSKVMALETQRQLAPMLAAKLDNMQQQIQLNVAQKLSAFDLMIKENIAQACKSKTIIDTFGKSVLIGVQGSLQAAFVESMSSTLIPAYEKSSQNMFKQLHEAFSVGIKEFMEQFDNYLQQLQPMHDSTEEILNKFSGFRQHLDSILTKHRNGVQDVMLDTRKDIKGLELLLSRQIQETIRSEVRKSFENQVAAIRSQANTPAPMYGLKDTIRHLLLQGQINKAFHQALLANDLSLVEFTLKSADHNAVFTPDCCLEQKVLLSLIQQISADMSDHNELKQNYLAEALLAINPMDPITREHAPKVLQELFRNCQMFLINYPKSSQCSNVRMLMKAVQAYKDQF